MTQTNLPVSRAKLEAVAQAGDADVLYDMLGELADKASELEGQVIGRFDARTRPSAWRASLTRAAMSEVLDALIDARSILEEVVRHEGLKRAEQGARAVS